MADQNKVTAGTKVTGTVPPDEDIISMIGEGIHTGLRKGSDAPSSGPLWQAISKSDDGAWTDALKWFLWGLRYSGWQIVKVDNTREVVGFVVDSTGATLADAKQGLIQHLLNDGMSFADANAMLLLFQELTLREKEL